MENMRGTVEMEEMDPLVQLAEFISEKSLSLIKPLEDYYARKKYEEDLGFLEWVAGDIERQSNLFYQIANEFQYPVYPLVNANGAITSQAFTLWQYYREEYGLEETISLDHQPWLPISAIGPILVMVHYLPHSAHTGGIPQTLMSPCLITEPQYRDLFQVLTQRVFAMNLVPDPKGKPIPSTLPMGQEDAVQFLLDYAYLSEESREGLIEFQGVEVENEDTALQSLPGGLPSAIHRLTTGGALVPIRDLPLPTTVLDFLPTEQCERYKILPFHVYGSFCYFCSPEIDFYEFEDYFHIHYSQNTMAVFYVEHAELQAAMETAHSKKAADLRGLAEVALSDNTFNNPSITADAQVISLDDSILTGEPPSEKAIEVMVYRILYMGVLKRASDIHIEPLHDMVRVRIRIDGVLHTLDELPLRALRQMVSKIKILSNLDINETRLPQDGRLPMRIRGRLVDFRVSVVPVVRNEKITLRIIDKSASIKSMGELRLPHVHTQVFNEALSKDKGLILVTGPTGSGKSSTLYACINKLNDGTLNIHTIEDPVEQEILGVNQTQIRADIHVTFAEMLKRIVRVDPDAIMVGEIRDLETAEAAVNASLTGHLVLSTLHTNDAIRAITRMGKLGVEPFLLGDSLLLLQAQRLVRTLCRCAIPTPLTEETRDIFNGAKVPVSEEISTILSPGKCAECGNTGYYGRIAVMELVPVDLELQHLITEQTPVPELEAHVEKNTTLGSLYQEGLKRVLQGHTTIEEVMVLRRAYNA